MNPLDWSAMQQLAALVWLAMALSTVDGLIVWSRHDRRDEVSR